MDQACSSGGLTAAGARSIVRAPYLQRTTSTSTDLLWTSTATSTVHVSVTRADGSRLARVSARRDRSASPLRGHQMIAHLGGLEPSTIYCYQLVRGTRALSRPAGFRTAPKAGTGAAVRFSTLGDLGKASNEQRMVLRQLMSVESDFVLINGDAAYERGTKRQLERHFFAVYEPMLGKVPFFLASGNHDYRTDDARPFREAFALFENGGEAGRERWYSFDWGDVHVVVLDTEKIGRAQAAWLDRDLSANELPWVVVTAHKPAYSSGHHGGSSAVRRHFVPLFAKHRVHLVIAGHDHNYERTKPIDGVTYLVTGAGGRGTRPVGRSSFTAFSQQVSHFTYVTVKGDTMNLYAIDAGGQLFDSAVIRR